VRREATTLTIAVLCLGLAMLLLVHLVGDMMLSIAGR